MLQNLDKVLLEGRFVVNGMVSTRIHPQFMQLKCYNYMCMPYINDMMQTLGFVFKNVDELIVGRW